MVKVSVFLMLVLVWGCSSRPQTSSPYPGMKLVWSDEFSYKGAPDPEKWGYDHGNGCPNLCGWGNNERQYYTDRPENVRVEDGFLTIEARKENFEESEFTSTRLVSKNKGDFLYGKFEIRAKLPTGIGTWPAVWMLPTDSKYGGWPSGGEIDIMEHVGYIPDTIYHTVHTGAYNGMRGTQRGGKLPVPATESEFHIYTLNWTPEKMEFYTDGQRGFTFEKEGDNTEKWPFDQAFYFILNLAVGGHWGGKKGVDPSIWPQKMLVDYIRVYQVSDSQN
ncbi:MAG: glycoside hydrolase family 16 protein [Bacteroidia bacterium]|nr:glycoside hydrolase family 16 protein [Bacteroidia bacterium]